MRGGIAAYMAMTSHDAATAESYGLPGAYLLYKISMEGLQKAAGGRRTTGGLMGIIEAPGLGLLDASMLARTIHTECGKRGFSGVLFDFTVEIHQQENLTRLCGMLSGRGLKVFLSREYSGCHQSCKIIMPSLTRGGSFNSTLMKYTAEHDPSRLCLEIVRACHEYQMPSFDRSGKRLDSSQLRELLQKYQPSPFYSPEMMCRYFSYRTEEGSVNFVLYDDPSCALKKIEAARNMGFSSVFILFSEWSAACRDIALGIRTIINA